MYTADASLLFEEVRTVFAPDNQSKLGIRQYVRYKDDVLLVVRE